MNIAMLRSATPYLSVVVALVGVTSVGWAQLPKEGMRAFHKTLTAGQSVSVSAEDCGLTVTNQGLSSLQIHCSQALAISPRDARITLKRNQYGVVDAERCMLAVTAKRSRYVNVRCLPIKPAQRFVGSVSCRSPGAGDSGLISEATEVQFDRLIGPAGSWSGNAKRIFAEQLGGLASTIGGSVKPQLKMLLKKSSDKQKPGASLQFTATAEAPAGSLSDTGTWQIGVNSERKLVLTGRSTAVYPGASDGASCRWNLTAADYTTASSVIVPNFKAATGEVWSCDPAISGSCVLLATPGQNGVPSSTGYRILTASGGGRVFFVIDSDASPHPYTLYSCVANQPGSCQPLASLGNADCSTSTCTRVKALLYGDNGRVYVGRSTNNAGGNLISCDPVIPNSCVDIINSSSMAVEALAYGSFGGQSRIFAGLYDGRIFGCDPYIESCGYLDKAGGPINTLTFGNGRLYAGIDSHDGSSTDMNGTLWTCDPQYADRCSTLDSAGRGIEWGSFAYGNGRLYAGMTDWYPGRSIHTFVWNCDATSTNSCSTLFDLPGAKQNIMDVQYAADQGVFFSTNIFTGSDNTSGPCQSTLHRCDLVQGTCATFQSWTHTTSQTNCMTWVVG